MTLPEFLEASEFELIQLMIENGIWKGPAPVRRRGKGELEFGIIPRWLNHPPPPVQEILDGLPEPFRELLRVIVEEDLPCHIDDQNYDALMARVRSEGLSGADGTIWGESTYEQLDPRWVYAVIDHVYAVCGPDGTDAFRHLPPGEPEPIDLDDGGRRQVRIAILADWGTGPYSDDPAGKVMGQIVRREPDCIIHLGDVYYAGTNDLFPPPGEERANFLALWPDPPEDEPFKSFTLNSNHEMYSGAYGYYDALHDPRFSAQRKVGYFALRCRDWTFVGLDSAWYSTSSLVMVGSIGPSDGYQAQWLRGLDLDPRRTILLTHHNALLFDGSGLNADGDNKLWDQVHDALGGDPAAWYWGHVHNGIVYDTPLVNGARTLCRCVGHAAIPFGIARGLPTKWAPWFVNEPDPQVPGRCLNGFALLTVEADGQIKEEYVTQNGDVVFANTYAPR